MNRLTKRDFPAYPSYKGSWAPVFMEPVIGCGEKITIAVSARGTDNSTKVVQAIRPEVLKCIYGDRYVELQSQIQWVIDSIERYMKQHKSANGWKAPLSGIDLGKETAAASDNIEGILKQGIRFSASLGTLAMTPKDEAVRDRFDKDVRDIVVSIKPHLNGYFNRKILLTNADHYTSFGYLSESYAANFGTIHLTHTQNDKMANSKILELESLRLKQGISQADKYDLILRVPPELTDLAIPDHTKERFSQRIDNLKGLAEKRNVELLSFDGAESAANHILEMAS